MNVYTDVYYNDVKWPISKEWFEKLEKKNGYTVDYERAPAMCVCTDGIVVFMDTWIANESFAHWFGVPKEEVETDEDLWGIYDYLSVYPGTMAEIEAAVSDWNGGLS